LLIVSAVTVGGDRGKAFPINYSEEGGSTTFGFSFQEGGEREEEKLCNEKVVCLRRVVPFLFGSVNLFD